MLNIIELLIDALISKDLERKRCHHIAKPAKRIGTGVNQFLHTLNAHFLSKN